MRLAADWYGPSLEDRTGRPSRQFRLRGGLLYLYVTSMYELHVRTACETYANFLPQR
jgi:hypothetical protein